MIIWWSTAVLGLWVLVSPWGLGFSQLPLARWGNIIAGIALLLLMMWALFGRKKEE